LDLRLRVALCTGITWHIRHGDHTSGLVGLILKPPELQRQRRPENALHLGARASSFVRAFISSAVTVEAMLALRHDLIGSGHTSPDIGIVADRKNADLGARHDGL
jgi:hypothetical protein